MEIFTYHYQWSTANRPGRAVPNNNFFFPDTLIQHVRTFIWTEGMYGHGDFELKLSLNSDTKRTLPLGTFIGHTESDRIMEVIQRETGIDGQGPYINLKGKSIDYLLEHRWIHGRASAAYTYDNAVRDINVPSPGLWIRDALPHQAIKRLFIWSTQYPTTIGPKMPWDGGLNQSLNSRLNKFEQVNTLNYRRWNDESDYPGSSQDWYFKSDTMKASLDSVAKPNGIGYGFVLNKETNRVHFDVYVGKDRLDRVYFSDDLDGVADIKTLETSENMHSYLLALSEPSDRRGVQRLARVNRPMTSTNVHWASGGFDNSGPDFMRRIHLIDGVRPENQDEHNTMSQEDLLTFMDQSILKPHGREHDIERLIEAEISSNTAYVYGPDPTDSYYLSDYVTLVDLEDYLYEARVVAQTFAKDENGIRRYPTLEFVRIRPDQDIE